MNSPNQAAMQKAFCRFFLALGDPAEAARRAGFPPDTAEESALRLLRTKSCRDYLSALCGQPPLPIRALVLSGLTRLAFGPISDAASLLSAENFPDADALRKLDLFAVSELKRDKGGGVEIKFFDRQRALEKLMECAGTADSDAAAEALLSALAGSGEGDAHADTETGGILP